MNEVPGLPPVEYRLGRPLIRRPPAKPAAGLLSLSRSSLSRREIVARDIRQRVDMHGELDLSDGVMLIET